MRISVYVRIYAILIAAIVLTFIIYIIGITFIQVPLEIPEPAQTIIVSLMFLTLAGGLMIYVVVWSRTRMERKEDIERELYRKIDGLSERLEHTESLLAMETHTFSIFDSVKNIEILDSKGRGRITYSLKCKNNPDKILNYIRIRLNHDGTLEEDSVKCTLNNREVEPCELQRLLTIDERTGKAVGSLPKTLTFLIRPEGGIKPGALFEYSYSYQVRNLYPLIKSKNKEYSQTLILHPTRRLRYFIKAPEGYKFDADIKIMVIDRDEVAYYAEEQRVKKECSPLLFDAGTTLLWDIIDPRIASFYRIYLTINRIE